jgi:hypothetical protein
MDLSMLDRVTALSNYRRNAAKLREAAKCGHLDLTIWHEGNKIDPASHIDMTCVRDAIEAACDAKIAEYEAELTRHGVTW